MFKYLPAPGTPALIIVTALLVLLTNKAGASALAFLGKPFIKLWAWIYSGIAPSNPLSISLRTYKRSLRNSDLARLENPVGPELKVPLRDAFAPLRLTSGSDRQWLDLFNFAADTERFMVLGGPGTGKTTLMKSLLMSVVNRTAREPLTGLVPVFVALRRMGAQNQTVNEAIIASFNDYHFPGADAFVKATIEAGKMLVILDGLDEVGANRESVIERIQDFCRWDEQQPHHNRIVVTCREASYQTQDLRSVIGTVVRVEPFTPHHMRVFLAGWPKHRDRSALNLFNILQADTQICQICSNPLLLTILTGLYLDSERFELPTSRERFYNAAIDELLIQRPARRAIRQTFPADEKRRVLERASLERLENARTGEDSEEIQRESLLRHAKSVLACDFDSQEFINELVQLDGILRETKEGSYACSHRTIQEYLSACEALRSKTNEQILEIFGSRPELAEVFYFYCGLIRNIPTLNKLAEHFLSRGETRIAARCALNSRDPIDKTLLLRIAAGIFENIEDQSTVSDVDLELLSSLAQRTGPEFQLFQGTLTAAISYLTQPGLPLDASGLESALAANPGLARTVLPALLLHYTSQVRWRGLALLRDLGTDEGLDQLVQFFLQSKGEDRTEAARVLADIMNTRPVELKRRVASFPVRKDLRIWPLERDFPGSVAIPIAEALAERRLAPEGALFYATAEVMARSGKLRSNQRWRLIAAPLLALKACGAINALLRGVRWPIYVFSVAFFVVATGLALRDRSANVTKRLGVEVLRTAHSSRTWSRFRERLPQPERIEIWYLPTEAGWGPLLMGILILVTVPLVSRRLRLPSIETMHLPLGQTRLAYNFRDAVIYRSYWALPLMFVGAYSEGPIAILAPCAGLLLVLAAGSTALANIFAIQSPMLMAATKITAVAEPSRKVTTPLDPGVVESPPAR
jgi:Cdc6-like AAA superfamily ATPase